MTLYKMGSTLHDVRKLDKQRFEVDGEVVEINVQRLDQHALLLQHQGKQSQIFALHQGSKIQAWYQGECYDLQIQTRQAAAAEGDISNQVSAPMTGKVIEVPVAPGDIVEKGVSLVILESMKMETSLSAPANATVSAVHCSPGDQVSSGQLLIELEIQEEQ